MYLMYCTYGPIDAACGGRNFLKFDKYLFFIYVFDLFCYKRKGGQKGRKKSKKQKAISE